MARATACAWRARGLPSRLTRSKLFQSHSEVRFRSIFVTALLAFRSHMFGRKRNKEENRYYLLPGMGRANKRKRELFFRWALVVGCLASLLLGYFIYLANRIGL